MATLQQATASQVQAWSKKVTSEYLNGSAFEPYMAPGGIISTYDDLKRQAGNVLHIPAVGKLRGGVVRGNNTLVGNELPMSDYGMKVTTDYIRTATLVTKNDDYKSWIDYHKQGQQATTDQLADELKLDLIKALRSIPVAQVSTDVRPEDAYVNFESATAAQSTAFLNANSDRVLFGSKVSNFSNVLATGIANINGDATKLAANKLSGALVELAKRKAMLTTGSTTFAIKPYRVSDGSKWFVLFTDSNGFRDFSNDPAVVAFNTHSRPREKLMEENPIFSGSDIMPYKGVIVVNTQELGNGQVLNGYTVNTATNVGYAQLCGVQAVNLAYSKLPSPIRRSEDDYGFLYGVGAEEIRGQSKASIGLTQIGMVSVFHTSQDDA